MDAVNSLDPDWCWLRSSALPLCRRSGQLRVAAAAGQAWWLLAQRREDEERAVMTHWSP